jgi:hypothetical protein
MGIFKEIKMWVLYILNKLGIVKDLLYTFEKDINGRRVKIYLDGDNTITMLKKDWEILLSTEEGRDIREYISSRGDIRLNLKDGDDING